MRILDVTAHNLYSFVQLRLSLSPGLNVLTGPNGAGKSSVGRVVQLCQAAVAAAASGDRTALTGEYAQAGRFGAERFRAGMTVEFTDAEERGLLELWSRAAMHSVLFESHDRERNERLAERLPPDVGGADVLARGTLQVTYDRSLRVQWRVRWCTDAGEIDLFTNEAGQPGSNPVNMSGWLTSGVTGTESLATKVTSLRLAQLLDAGWFPFAVRPTGLNAEPAPLLAAYRAAKVLPDSTSSTLGFGWILQRLLRGLVVSVGARAAGSAVVPFGVLADPGEDRDGAIGLRLLRRKNGAPALRAGFAEAVDIFETLTGSRLDVVEQAVETGPDSQELVATPVVPVTQEDGSVADVPLRLSGQGLVEAARLALVLSEATHTLVLDEPATELSAVAQRRLVTQLLVRARTRQTVVITHSAHLVPIATNADVNCVRLSRDRDGQTVVHQVRRDLARLGKNGQLLADSDIRDTLFAAAVWLVEGPTEQEALRTWLADAAVVSPAPTPEAAHVLVVPVDGALNFPRYAKLMDEMGIAYGILADGPALRPGGPLRTLPGAPALQPDDDFGVVRAAWAGVGVWTLADGFHDDGSRRGEIEAYFESLAPDVWAGIRGNGKIRRGGAFAATVPTPAEVVEAWKLLLIRLGVHG